MDVEMIPSAGLEDQHDDKDDSGIEQDNSWLYIRIAVEDHNLQKVLKLNLDDTVWNAKQKVLQVLLRVKIPCTLRNTSNRLLVAGTGRWSQFRLVFTAMQWTRWEVPR